MSDISLISLHDLTNWDMRQFASPIPKINHWNTETELVSIGALASSRLANGYSVERIGCISPADVITQSASVEASNRYLTQHYFDWSTEDIKIGDLLISRAGAVYVDKTLQDLVFSSQFVLLRPLNISDGFLLWAILNSTPGKNSLVEFFYSTDSSDLSQVVVTKDFIRDFSLPRINMDQNSLNSIESLVKQIQHKVTNSIDRPSSWVSVKSLNLGDDWFRAISSKLQPIKNSGNKLEELIDTVIVGKTNRNVENESKRIYMPFVTPKYVVHGRKSDLRQELLSKSTSALSKIGDLIIATSTKKAYFYLNDIDSILGTGVVAIRPKPGVTAEKLLSIFASASVQLDLNYLLSRGIVGHLSKSDLMNLAIPLDWETGDQAPANILMLRTQLDALLWK
jgi:restriction endonuclease S subunit